MHAHMHARTHAREHAGGKGFILMAVGTNLKQDKIAFSGQVSVLGKLNFSASADISDTGLYTCV